MCERGVKKVGGVIRVKHVTFHRKLIGFVSGKNGRRWKCEMAVVFEGVE